MSHINFSETLDDLIKIINAKRLAPPPPGSVLSASESSSAELEDEALQHKELRVSFETEIYFRLKFLIYLFLGKEADEK